MSNQLNNSVNYRTKSNNCPQLKINFNNHKTAVKITNQIEFIQKSEIKRTGVYCVRLNEILNLINS
jgi:hypothetical protein